MYGKKIRVNYRERESSVSMIERAVNASSPDVGSSRNSIQGLPICTNLSDRAAREKASHQLVRDVSALALTARYAAHLLITNDSAADLL